MGTEQRDAMVAKLHEEAQLQIVLLQHQVQKAQIEKAEIKADMTKERLELSQDLLLERERARHLEEDTANWRQKYEVSSSQVKKMNTASMEREAEVTSLKKKLETMVKLNKTLSQERTTLLEKCKALET